MRRQQRILISMMLNAGITRPTARRIRRSGLWTVHDLPHALRHARRFRGSSVERRIIRYVRVAASRLHDSDFSEHGDGYQQRTNYDRMVHGAAAQQWQDLTQMLLDLAPARDHPLLADLCDRSTGRRVGRFDPDEISMAGFSEYTMWVLANVASAFSRLRL